MGGIFINYRGADSDTTAVLIDRELAARFGSDQVFLDSRSIPAGVDFAEELLGRLRACSVLLVVVGPRWMTLTDAAGRPRIYDPDDWIRREIVEAFSHGLRVIPVLTDGASLPVERDLPEDIAGLSRRQYVPLRRRYASVDLTFLIERIIEIDPELAKIASSHQSSVEPQQPAGTPSPYGLLEDPLEELGLAGVPERARQLAAETPRHAAELLMSVTEVLRKAGYPGHADMFAQEAASVLLDAGHAAEAFDITWRIAIERFLHGSVHEPISPRDWRTRLADDPVRVARSAILDELRDWYGCALDLPAIVEALDVLRDADYPDYGVLTCVAIEQALTDGLFTTTPPASWIGPPCRETPRPSSTGCLATPGMPSGSRGIGLGAVGRSGSARGRSVTVLAEASRTPTLNDLLQSKRRSSPVSGCGFGDRTDPWAGLPQFLQ